MLLRRNPPGAASRSNAESRSPAAPFRAVPAPRSPGELAYSPNGTRRTARQLEHEQPGFPMPFSPLHARARAHALVPAPAPAPAGERVPPASSRRPTAVSSPPTPARPRMRRGQHRSDAKLRGRRTPGRIDREGSQARSCVLPREPREGGHLPGSLLPEGFLVLGLERGRNARAFEGASEVPGGPRASPCLRSLSPSGTRGRPPLRSPRPGTVLGARCREVPGPPRGAAPRLLGRSSGTVGPACP